MVEIDNSHFSVEEIMKKIKEEIAKKTLIYLYLAKKSL